MLPINQGKYYKNPLKQIDFELPPALKSLNFSCFVIGESLSFFGSWMTQIALIWLVYKLTIVIGMLQGTVKAFDLPARQVIIPRIIEKKSDTYSAMASHSFLINTAKFVSPMIGGILIARSGAASCFLVDTMSYLPFLSAILTVKLNSNYYNSSGQKSQIWQNLKEGFIFTYKFLPIKFVLMLQILICFMGMTYVNLMPIFSDEILNGDAETMGYLMTASAFGSIFAGLYLISRKEVLGLGKIIAISSILLGLGLILFSRSTSLIICLVFIFLVGMTNSLALAAISNFIQLTLVDENKRGRVTSIFTTGFLGILPIGNLFFGGLASLIGVNNALFFGGVCCLIGGLIFARNLPKIHKIVQPIYEDMGLMAQSSTARRNSKFKIQNSK